MGPSRRKSGFERFAVTKAPPRLRKLMSSKNEARGPEGFEATVAERAMPLYSAEIAEGQSLKHGCKALRAHQPLLARFFHRDKAYFKGGKS